MAGPMDVHISSMVRCQEHVEKIRIKFENLVVDMSWQERQRHGGAIRDVRKLLAEPMGV